ncbi:MAG TPA: hypothetical protein VK028_01060 [Micromonosporaceae bacterium]|nr:hypothetical protein [Micromonosporaceae bacterium]
MPLQMAPPTGEPARPGRDSTRWRIGLNFFIDPPLQAGGGRPALSGGINPGLLDPVHDVGLRHALQ